MLYKVENIISISVKIEEYINRFEKFIDKFTSNGILASFITIGLFVLLCLFINNHANK